VKELCFTEIAGDDPSKLAVVWEPFRKHLEAKTGLKVKYLSHLDPPSEPAVPAPAPVPGDQGGERDPEPSSPNGVTHLNQQLDLMKAGKLHVTAFSTGQVPMAVNQVGFVPLYAPATKEGNFAYEVQVIVPTDSAVKDLQDLKGKTIAFVSLSSNSGGRAPIVRLREKAGLTILKDYRYVLTGSHWNSIYGICFGRDAAAILANKNSREESRKAVLDRPGPKYDAASVASDLLAREVASGAVKENQFRTIYRDGPYPSLCFGVPHNLKPELVAKIKDAFETFSFEGNSVGEKYKDSNHVKFIKVDYKKDWQAVRDIDQMLPDAVEGK
jgi:phosphonate transport system substrate-binding protein